MASNIGTATFTSGTGAKSFNIGVSGTTWMELEFGNSAYKHSRGFIYGGNQYSFSDESSPAVTKALQIKDNSGTVVFEGTWTNFTGTNVNFNVTTNTLGTPTVLLKFGS